MSSQIRLRLLPGVRCLFDEPIQVKVAGLKPRQVVSVRARATDEKGLEFRSSATYRADGSGFIHLDRDPSLGGSYVGVEPMGLLWSLRAEKLHQYFFKNKALEPLVVKFSVHEGDEQGRMLAEETHERFLIGDGVSRFSVKEGNFEGVLFTPPGQGPFPAVLDLCTFMSEKRASLLANKGFVVLAVAVHTEKPSNNKPMHLDHFKEAVDFLQRQPKVGSKGVGIISRSKGGDVALSLAAFVSGVAAVVWINGCSAVVGSPLYFKNQEILSPLPVDWSKEISHESGASIVRYVLGDPRAEENRGTVVPVEQAQASFLFVASGNDLHWDSEGYMDEMVERLKHHGKKNFETVCYPKAGHLLEPPYGPFCPSATHGRISTPVLWGGEPSVHAAAEVHLWKKIQEFLTDHLRCGSKQSKAQL
ncbi:acyl-coenzyme A thioesterase 1-like isoform X2 [Betta splendens]|nr:acyl-coenzyme A thioesterase 1-like isoform X2 [Betta splendens]XP_028987800.1 acyl-coenzyme A thioesterase 1-like isoform X2 [Betta splendens]